MILKIFEMKTINKLIFVKYIILSSNLFYAQTQLPLYKMVMNSDLIISVESNDYQFITYKKTEYYSENFVKFVNDFEFLKNKKDKNIKGLLNKIEVNNNDCFININGESCSGNGNIQEKDKKYYNIFFLKRKNNQYFVIAHLWNNIIAESLSFFKKNIKEINLISKETDKKLKYIKIQNWFEVSNNEHPNEYMVESPFTEELNSFFGTR
jgi:hypothetical protein